MFTFLHSVPHPCYSSIASVYPARKRSIRRWHEVNGSNETLMLVFRGLAWRRRTPHRAEVAGAVEVAEVKRRPRRLQAPPPPPRNCRRTRPIRCSIRLRSSVVSQFFFPHFFLFPVSSFSFCFFFSSTIYIFLYFCISCAPSSYQQDLVVAYIDMYTSVDKSPNIHLLWAKWLIWAYLCSKTTESWWNFAEKFVKFPKIQKVVSVYVVIVVLRKVRIFPMTWIIRRYQHVTRLTTRVLLVRAA